MDSERSPISETKCFSGFYFNSEHLRQPSWAELRRWSEQPSAVLLITDAVR